MSHDSMIYWQRIHDTDDNDDNDDSTTIRMENFNRKTRIETKCNNINI